MFTAREREEYLLNRCTDAARHQDVIAQNELEANVFRLASMLIRSSFAVESKKLSSAGEAFFAQHSVKPMSAADLVRNGCVISLPRLHDMLSHKLTTG